MKEYLKFIIIYFLIFLINKKIVLKIPLFDEPKVSIIILNYNCISSILRAKPIIPYEIIIGNRMSKRKNRGIKKNFMNFNRALKLTKGKYIILLNNVKKVHKDWLLFLIKLIESDNEIGMIGSKLINLNGKLEEAGGIVWKEGEYSNYGSGENPNLPQYNYVKEVDFISFNSIILRKSIWEIIGGSDEKYSSIYYQDIDFSFKMRKYGYKVMYQPRSVVEIYEGILNEDKISKRIKNYKFKNKIKFIKKWRDELTNQEKETNIFLARDRRYNNRILVIDRFIPKFDKDSGSRCSFLYLKLFNEIGLQVSFLADDFKKYEPYTTILQQKGIEVLYGDWYEHNFEKWLKQNLKHFNYVYLQRPEITYKYLDLIKNYFTGKIFYFAHDLHYLRLFREYNITHDESKLKQSKYSEKIEMEIFSKVDIIHVVGNYEEKMLKNKYQNKIIRNIPIFIYEKQLINIEKDFSKRKDLIFVGGFLHSPNKDGILWFTKEIFPKIVQKYPDIILHIVGSNIPKSIEKLKTKNIKIEGFLQDEQLYSLYQKCRIAVVPLRFGAGVKGKIIEAAYNQIPVVTTSIGEEGLENSNGAFLSENNPQRMAKLIIELYLDFKKLKEMSDSGKKYIEKYFTSERAKEIIMKDIKITRKIT